MKYSWKKRLDVLNNPEAVRKHYSAMHIECVDSILFFINFYCFTFDPRKEKDREMPFELFPKQEEYVKWVWNLYKGKEEGVVSKSRGIGFSWMNAAISVYFLIFYKSFTVSMYTYKSSECDERDNIDTLIEKCNFIISRLPDLFKNNIERKLMQITNHNNGSVIAGKAGDSPGRGGRSSIYFVDEAAFYQRDEPVEAAVSRNADTKVWGSTFNGTNNLFYRKYTSPLSNIFTFDWFELPIYTKEWFEKEKAKAEAEGTFHLFAQEVLRDASASVESVVIPGSWVLSAIQCDISMEGRKVAGFDVADGGRDTNALTILNGNILEYCEEFGGEVDDATDRFFWKCVEHDVFELKYDSIGVGSGVKVRIRDILSSLPADHKAHKIRISPWNAGGKIMRPDQEDFSGITNQEMFDNAKAQTYWQVRFDFLQTYRYVNGQDCDKSRVVFFPDKRSTSMEKLIRELSQPQFRLTKTGKTSIDKAPNGAKSPNMCDSFIIASAETEEEWIAW